MARSTTRGNLLREPHSAPRLQLGPVQFFREIWAELAKCEWPTRQEAVRLTGIVIAIAAAVAVFLGAIDFLFNIGGGFILGT